MADPETFHIKISSNFELEVKAKIQGADEKQTRHYPGSSRWVELFDVPLLPSGWTKDDIREKIMEQVEKQERRSPYA